MATISLTMNECGGSSTTQKIFYGKKEIVTGTGISGTGWTLYSGAPIAANTTSVTITGLDDNVQYVVERYCNCPTLGDNGPESAGPFEKKVCGTFATLTPGNSGVNFTAAIPPSVNSAGSWISHIVFDVYDSSGNILLGTHIKALPISSNYSASINGLSPATDYKIRMTYANVSKSMSYSCAFTNFSTLAACSAPQLTLTPISSTSVQVAWSVSQSYAGDSYNVIRNGTTVASGLPISSSPYLLTGLTPNSLYQIGVQRNCGQGGTATGQSSIYTYPLPSITQTSNIISFGIRRQQFTVGDSVQPGNRFTISIYGCDISYTSIPGDNKNDVATRLVELINNKTTPSWLSCPGSPLSSIPYYKPLAGNSIPSQGYIVTVELNPSYSATSQAYVS